jgi:hypothetical protein
MHETSEGVLPMSDTNQAAKEGGSAETIPKDLGHPIGTLVIVGLFGVLFGLGWLLMYLWLFLQRGGLHP